MGGNSLLSIVIDVLFIGGDHWLSVLEKMIQSVHGLIIIYTKMYSINSFLPFYLMT